MSKGKLLGRLCYAAVAVIAIALITLVIFGYFVTSVNRYGEITDGLGRILDEVNLPRYVLPQWAGIVWFVVDCVILLCAFFGIDNLIAKAKVYLSGIQDVDF